MVEVFPVTKTPTGRSFRFDRELLPLYSGMASVKLVTDATRARFEGRFSQEWQVIVTLPLTVDTATIDRAEIEWDGQLIHIEGQSLRDKSGNPLAISWGGSLRSPV